MDRILLGVGPGLRRLLGCGCVHAVMRIAVSIADCHVVFNAKWAVFIYEIGLSPNIERIHDEAVLHAAWIRVVTRSPAGAGDGSPCRRAVGGAMESCPLPGDRHAPRLAAHESSGLQC